MRGGGLGARRWIPASVTMLACLLAGCGDDGNAATTAERPTTTADAGPRVREPFPQTCDELATHWQVFLDPDATPEQTEAIRVELAAIPDTDDVDYLDQKTSYELFKQLFAADPEVFEGVTVADMPPRFDVYGSVPGPETIDRIKQLPDVYDVVDRRDRLDECDARHAQVD